MPTIQNLSKNAISIGQTTVLSSLHSKNSTKHHRGSTQIHEIKIKTGFSEMKSPRFDAINNNETKRKENQQKKKKTAEMNLNKNFNNKKNVRFECDLKCENYSIMCEYLISFCLLRHQPIRECWRVYKQISLSNSFPICCSTQCTQWTECSDQISSRRRCCSIECELCWMFFLYFEFLYFLLNSVEECKMPWTVTVGST